MDSTTLRFVCIALVVVFAVVIFLRRRGSKAE